MKTYTFTMSRSEKDAVYHALYKHLLTDVDLSIYSPELARMLLCDSPQVTVTQDQLRAILNGLRLADEPTDGSRTALPYRAARLALLEKSRSQYHLVC